MKVKSSCLLFFMFKTQSSRDIDHMTWKIFSNSFILNFFNILPLYTHPDLNLVVYIICNNYSYQEEHRLPILSHLWKIVSIPKPYTCCKYDVLFLIENYILNIIAFLLSVAHTKLLFVFKAKIFYGSEWIFKCHCMFKL